MFNSKRGNIILSVIIAIALWAYVVGEIDPNVTKVYKDVPISLINESTLYENNLAVLSQSQTTVDVTLTGKRSNISKIGINDIQATVDLNNAVKGENELKIDITVPDKTELEDKSISKITVVVEESSSVDKEIKIKYTGDFPEDTEPYTVESNFDKVTVTGAKSQVNKVDHVEAIVDSNQVKTTLRTVNSELVAVDAKGNKVENLELSHKFISISTILYKTKTVTLNVPVEDNSDGSIDRTVSAPKTIIIKGEDELIKNISSIDTKSVDISNITATTKIDLVPILPDNVQISDKSDNLVITVTVKSLTSKTFTFNTTGVSLNGLADDLNADIVSSDIVITISGTQSQLDAITKSDIKLSATLSGLTAGTHQVALDYKCDKNNGGITSDVENITVVIDNK